ncbi:hypothetical protein RRG08_001087 [Elysia crispata]|uniref:Uncharacterized protein n=1 Tax=Elysia crispata TaxID=231223 RepID=A0AAE1E643_9GAST|nr:hypothetical protein RRG08_001087 [Elysia crispata]
MGNTTKIKTTEAEKIRPNKTTSINKVPTTVPLTGPRPHLAALVNKLRTASRPGCAMFAPGLSGLSWEELDSTCEIVYPPSSPVIKPPLTVYCTQPPPLAVTARNGNTSHNVTMTV